MKRLFLGVLIIFVITLCALVYIEKNNSTSSWEKMIKKNYADIKLFYVNKYDNYYIFISEKNYGVLDRKFEEILLVDKKNLCKKKKNYDIIYKDQKLMYMEDILKKKNLIFNYYDINNCELINSVSLGG